MMKRRNVRTLSLIVVTFTYLLIGAAVFDALEGPNNENAHDALNDMKEEFMTKYNVTKDDYKILELLIIEKKPHKSGPQWKFAGSFYYALVVLTLIGYGHSTPATSLGKTFTMCYAMAGIPMAMVMFQSMGERMNKFYSVAIKKVRYYSGCSRIEASEVDVIIASLMTSNLVIVCGAMMYHMQEGWTFFDSFYYTFITLSTIGFGDFVALQQGSQALQFHPGYVVCSFIFLLVGLAVLSSSVNLLVLRFMILSLEEDEQEDLQDASQNVVTLDGELMAVNGRVLAGQSFVATSERNICATTAKESDNNSVCSCTCYGQSSSFMKRRGVGRTGAGTTAEAGDAWKPRSRFLWCFGKMFGCRESVADFDEENFYDSETQSISNYAKHAVKRASF